MKKSLFLAAVIVALPTAPAFAQDADTSLAVSLGASLPKSCEFKRNASLVDVTLSNEVPDAADRVAYSCNYIGTPVVTITSLNGGLAPDQASVALGARKVDYQIAFGDNVTVTGGASGRLASEFLTGVSSPDGPGAWTRSTAPNERMRPRLSLHLTRPIEIAGDYSDTLSFSIAP